MKQATLRSVESTGRTACVFITSDVLQEHRGLLTRAALCAKRLEQSRDRKGADSGRFIEALEKLL